MSNFIIGVVMKVRGDVALNDCWNLAPLYVNFSEWEKERKGTLKKEDRPKWPELASFKGTLGNGADTLKNLFVCYFAIERSLSKIYTYAHLKHDEDIAVD